MKRLLLLLLCLLLALGCAACGEDTTDTTLTDTNDDYTVAYVPNEAVNQFILDLKETSPFDIQGVESGSAPNEYIVMYNECWVTLLPRENGMEVIVEPGKGSGAEERLFTVFRYLVRAADSSCSTQQVEAAEKFMKEQTSSSPSYRVSSYVSITSYLPPVHIETVDIEGRLDMVFYNYTHKE